MNKLRNKTFLVIWVLLTFFAMVLLFIFNHQIYKREKVNIIETFNRVGKINIGFFDRLPIFMDVDAYVIYFDRNNNISRIVSYTNDGLTNEEVSHLAINYLNKKNNYSNNLYISNYLFEYNGSSLILFDNREVSDLLSKYLNISLLVFLLFEIINFLLSYKLTGWLVLPVIEAFDKQKQFIYDVSHELKTPIAVIMANADMACDNPSEEKWVLNIKNESERMNKLVISLLDLLISDNFNEKDNFNKINLSKCIEICILTFESLIYENNLKLDYEVDSNIYFNCNEERIKQLFAILVDNAIKHANSDSKITIRLKKNKDCIVLSVRNKGESIAKEDREKIFERFYRVDKSRNRNENRYGLGLAIAKNIVTVHGGKISVNCSKGYTTFNVIF